MVHTEANPDRTPVSVFDGFRSVLAAHRAEFYQAVASGPFYGFTVRCRRFRAGDRQLVAAGDDGQRACALRGHRGVLRDRPDGGPEGHLRADPGDSGRRRPGRLPYRDASLKQHELLSDSTFKTYEGYPLGMLILHADVINSDLLAFTQQ